MTDDWSLSVTIVEALAEVEGVDPVDLDCRLHDSIDTDAVELLSKFDGGEWQLRFFVDSHEVTVDSDRVITVDGRVIREPTHSLG